MSIWILIALVAGLVSGGFAGFLVGIAYSEMKIYGEPHE